MKMKKLAIMALATALSVGSVMTASAAWIEEGSNWRYQNDNGTFQAGSWFRDADGRWYHFDNNGIMQRGWFQDTDGKWYFLAYNGVMQVGLIKVDNKVYFMNPSGDLFIGDKAINGTTYNFGLYGTTNGTPSVPMSATFGGNGNQSLSGGVSGGSSSSSSGGSGGGSDFVPDDSDKTKSTTVDSIEKLHAKAKEGYTDIKYKTDASGEVTLTDEEEGVKYNKISLTVEAPNQSIRNDVSFKKITIKAVKPNTWFEDGTDNNLSLESDARIVSNGEGTKVSVDKAGIQVQLDGGSSTELNVSKADAVVTSNAPIVATVSADVTLVVNDTAGSKVTVTKPVTVDVKATNPAADAAPLNVTTTADATVKTAIPTAIVSEGAINVVVTNSAAAEGVTLKGADSSADEKIADSKVTNETLTPVEVKVEKSDDTVADSITEDVNPDNSAETFAKAGIEAAVKSANSSSYIGATLKDDVITVTIKSTSSPLVSGLPTARAILNIFKSVEGVGDVTVDNGSELVEVNSEDQMIEAARVFGLTGGSDFDDAKGDYKVAVYFNGDNSPLIYTVVIK